MVSDWSRVQISEVCSLIVDCVNKTAPRVEYETEYRMLRTPNIKNGRIDRGSCRFVEKETFEKWTRRAKVLRGDILLTREAPMGQVGYVDFDDSVFLGQRIMQYRVNSDLLEPKFLLYSFLSPDLQNQFQRHEGSGSVVSHIRVPDCLKFKINLPSLAEQKVIVNILGGLDDKIELNRQINKTLEQIAEALFKSWFIDFEPVKAKIHAKKNNKEPELAAMQAISGKNEIQFELWLKSVAQEEIKELAITAGLFSDELVESELGEIPRGWNIKQVQDLAKTIKGKSYKSSELEDSTTALVTLKSFMRGGGYRLDGLKEYTGKYKPEQEVFAGDLIVAYTDVTQAADVIGKPAMVISDLRYDHLVISLDVAVIRPEIDSHKYFLYGMAKTDIFQNHTRSYTTGTTVLHLGKSAVPEYSFVKPTEELLQAYKEIVAPMFELINENIEESKNLGLLRDTLLPKLLSGEVVFQNSQITVDDLTV